MRVGPHMHSTKRLRRLRSASPSFRSICVCLRCISEMSPAVSPLRTTSLCCFTPPRCVVLLYRTMLLALVNTPYQQASTKVDPRPAQQPKNPTFSCPQTRFDVVSVSWLFPPIFCSMFYLTSTHAGCSFSTKEMRHRCPRVKNLRRSRQPPRQLWPLKA